MTVKIHFRVNKQSKAYCPMGNAWGLFFSESVSDITCDRCLKKLSKEKKA